MRIYTRAEEDDDGNALRILPDPRRFGAPQGAGSPRATWLSDPSSTTSSPASTTQMAYYPVGHLYTLRPYPGQVLEASGHLGEGRNVTPLARP